MPDSGEIGKAVVARLSGDATLMGLVPDGVYVHEAAQGTTKFALVSLVSSLDAGQMAAPGQRRATEDALYAVKAVILGTSRTAAGQAAARIDALLEDQPLAIVGYACLSIARTEVIDDTEVDDVDNAIRWQHRGGRYRILAAPLHGG